MSLYLAVYYHLDIFYQIMCWVWNLSYMHHIIAKAMNTIHLHRGAVFLKFRLYCKYKTVSIALYVKVYAIWNHQWRVFIYLQCCGIEEMSHCYIYLRRTWIQIKLQKIFKQFLRHVSWKNPTCFCKLLLIMRGVCFQIV